MYRKIFYLIVLFALLLTACNGAEATTPSEVEQPTEAPPVGEKITLKLWSHQNAAFQKGNDAIIAKYEEQNPNIDIVYETFPYDQFIQTLQTSMPAGTEADVIEMFGTWVCSYANGGRLAELPDDVMTYAKAQEIFYQAPLDGYYCGGKLYGLPHEYNLEVGGVLANPALFEAHGVTYPPEWANFSDMIADASKMSEFDGETMTKSGFHYVTGDGLPFLLLEGILEQGGNYFADDGLHYNIDTPEARKLLQLLVDISQKDKVIDPVLFNSETNWVGDAFFAGNVAIGFVGSWAAGEGVINYPDLEFDYVNIPPLFGTQYKYAADSGWGKVVSVNTKYKEEAFKLAMFMTAEQASAMTWNVETKTIPAMKSIVENPDEFLKAAPWIETTFKLLPYGQYIGNLTDRDQFFYEIAYPHMLEAIQGVLSVDEAIKLIHQEANEMVDAAQ